MVLSQLVFDKGLLWLFLWRERSLCTAGMPQPCGPWLQVGKEAPASAFSVPTCHPNHILGYPAPKIREKKTVAESFASLSPGSGKMMWLFWLCSSCGGRARATQAQHPAVQVLLGLQEASALQECLLLLSQPFDPQHLLLHPKAAVENTQSQCPGTTGISCVAPVPAGMGPFQAGKWAGSQELIKQLI